MLMAPLALFAILQYTAPVPELGSQVLSVVAIFLPLSSIWASATLENAAVDNVPNQKFGPALPSPGNSGTSRRALIGQRNESGAGTATALGSGSGTGSITAFKHKRVSDIDEDLEAVASDSIKLEKRSLV